MSAIKGTLIFFSMCFWLYSLISPSHPVKTGNFMRNYLKCIHLIVLSNSINEKNIVPVTRFIIKYFYVCALPRIIFAVSLTQYIFVIL